MNARTSLPLLVVMTLAAAPAAAQPASAIPGLGGLGGGQNGFDLINQTAMLGGDYSANDHMQMEQWYKDAEARGEVVLWNPDRSTWRELNGTMVPTQFGQIFGDMISYTDGVRKQSSIGRPLTPAERGQAAKAVADKRQEMLARHSSECAEGFVGPPSPGVDCEKFKKLTDQLAKLDPDALQRQDAENSQWGGNDKGKSADKGAGDGDKKSGGMGIMSAGSDEDGGERSASDDTPNPNPTRPPANETVAASGGGDTGFDDGGDIAGDSGQVTGDTGRVGGSGGEGGTAGRSSGQGGGDKGRGFIGVEGNEAVAEHTRKYGKGYTFSAVSRAAEGSGRILDEASDFAGEDAKKVRAQEAPPVHYGTMKITPGGGQAAPGEN